MGSQARLPVTPILLLLKIWVDTMLLQRNLSLSQVNDAQFRLGALERHPGGHAFEDHLDVNPAILHKLLLNAFDSCNGYVRIFVRQLSNALAPCIDSICQLEDLYDDSSLQVELWELRHLFDILQAMISSVETSYDSTVLRIDLCMRVVSFRLYGSAQRPAILTINLAL